MLQNIGIPGLIIILVITLIIFGPKKLPEIGSAFGKTLSEFKKSAQDIMSSEEVEPTKKGIEVAEADKVTDLIKK
ncbi:twin-arginine translocase TatA/TatE family subunit [Peribacillus loiseleuriae]|uniref:twin-arginine translocase TatA/TatE family subunit n=1 Tax=Peribacillus loiseleuriae TaxID=1679170 RepID=UPI00383000DF